MPARSPRSSARHSRSAPPPAPSGCSTSAARPARSCSTSPPPDASGILPPVAGLIERYRDRLPFAAGDPIVTLEEGGTPLVSAPRLSARVGAEVYLKLEGANP